MRASICRGPGLRIGEWWLLGAALCAAQAAPSVAQTSGAASLWATQGAGCRAPESEAEPWRNPDHAPECRARVVLEEFRTLEEKLRFLAPPTEGQSSEIRDVAGEMGLPRLDASDGPAGLTRLGAGATALPSPLAVGASFDPAIARRYGELLASEFRDAGIGTILGPAFDIARSWKFGRLSESFGEDPFLMAEMAAAQVRALTEGNVLTMMKHYAVYAQEAGRVGDQPSGSSPTGDNIVSEKALREIYLPGFEAAVKRGGAGAVMCSFPKVNGVYACEHPHLYDILKREWAFDGYVGPDFPSAQRSITRAVLAGLDTGSLAPGGVNAGVAGEKPLIEAVRDGEVPEARIDDMILRRLIPAFRVGLYDDPPAASEEPVTTAENRAAAADILAAGTVLLKNERGILPFGSEVRSIAVIGLQATEQATVVEQGSPYVEPAHFEPALPAIEGRATGKRVRFAQGTLGLDPLPPIDPARVEVPGGGRGFLAEYAANRDLDFSQVLARRTVEDPSLGRSPEIDGLPGGNGWSVRYSGRFAPAVSGVHRFTLHGSGTARLIIGGEELGGFELADFGNAAFANLPLEAGRPVDIVIEYTPRSALRPERMEMFGLEMGLTLRFGHAPPDGLIAHAADTAAAADVAVVFVGERVGEGMDRHTLSLQGDQDALIEAVARANPNTVVVLNTGGPVAMPWLGRVRAVMEMWLPGDAFGSTVAGLLFGDREPGGRLPVTFPADEAQGPATRPHQFPGLYHPVTGKLDTAYFEEGVFVGYRYWDEHGQEPLFPFGHGLNYGEVAMEAIGVEPRAGGGAVARVRLRNTGSRRAAEVAQLYLGFPDDAAAPPRQLKGFARAELVPGETRIVEIALPPEAFRYWDEGAAGWRTAPGPYRVMIGRSSRDIVWEGSVTPID
jgi:beta-glucosidase